MGNFESCYSYTAFLLSLLRRPKLVANYFSAQVRETLTWGTQTPDAPGPWQHILSWGDASGFPQRRCSFEA